MNSKTQFFNLYFIQALSHAHIMSLFVTGQESPWPNVHKKPILWYHLLRKQKVLLQGRLARRQKTKLSNQSPQSNVGLEFKGLGRAGWQSNFRLAGLQTGPSMVSYGKELSCCIFRDKGLLTSGKGLSFEFQSSPGPFGSMWGESLVPSQNILFCTCSAYMTCSFDLLTLKNSFNVLLLSKMGSV